MEVEKPFADKITHVLQAQYVLAEYRNPLGAATTDQLFDRFGALKVVGLQTQQADVAGAVSHRLQRTAVDLPAGGAQTGQ